MSCACCSKFFRRIAKFFKELFQLKGIIITIIVLLAPLNMVLQSDSKVTRCGYTVIVMAVLWLTEALPIPVTALLPIVLLPLLGVATAKEVSGSYVTDTSMLFVGGLIVAVAVEECGLHKRIALSILRIVGSQTNLLMLGLMLPTWFLSMWISNTAAASMMVPIISAVTDQVKAADTEEEKENNNGEARREVMNLIDQKGDWQGSVATHNDGIQLREITRIDDGGARQHLIQDTTDIEKSPRNASVKQEKGRQKSAEHKGICKALALSIAYAANTGGIATLTGSPPNLVLKGIADGLYERTGKNPDGSLRTSGITFSNWLAFALPVSFLVMILGWVWLQLFVLRCKKICGCCKKEKDARDMAIRSAIDNEYKALGGISFSETIVTILFFCLAMLWIFREPPNISGWGSLFPDGYTSDSTPAILIAVLLFLLPSELPNILCLRKKGDDRKPSYKPILDWDTAMGRLPWGVIILLGGGFALAKASDKSGLSKWVGEGLSVFSSYDPWVMNLLLSAIVAAATEVTSNTATATLLLPILAKLAIAVNIHPLYLMISSAVACSFAFMLPVATPPSAIVFSHGYLTIPDMASAGLMMNVIAVLVLTFGINTWGITLFSLESMPQIFVSGQNINSSLVNGTISLIQNATIGNTTFL